MQGPFSSHLTIFGSKVTQAARDWPVAMPAPTRSRRYKAGNPCPYIFQRIHPVVLELVTGDAHENMDTQQQNLCRKKPLSGASKRPDAFWSLIVPSARLEKGRLDTTNGAYPAHPQTNHAEELEDTQPMIRKEKGNPHVITRANAAELYDNLGVTSKDIKPVKRRATARPEAITREEPADFYTGILEDRRRTQAQPVIRREKGGPEPTTRAQRAHPYISLAEQLKRTQPVESDEHADDGGLSEGQAFAPISAFHKGDEDEESFEGPADTEGSDGDEGYVENNKEDDSETASDASSPATQRSRLSYDTPRRASARARGSQGGWLKEASEVAIIAKRKTVPSEPASAKERNPRKKLKVVFEESDEEDDQEATYESLPQSVARLIKARAQPQSFPILRAQPPLSRKNQPWTKKENETLFRLRSQGKSWKFIGERVLGRTARGVEVHWDDMRTESLQPVEARAKGRRQRETSSVVSVMAKIPHKKKKKNPWSKEEDGKLISLRAQGKSLIYICRRIRGREYSACKVRWRKIKDQYPQAVTDSEDLKSHKREDPSDRQSAQFSSESQFDQEAKEAESNSRSAIVECEDPESSTNDDSFIDPDENASAARQTSQMTVAGHVNLPSATANKNPKSKATSTDHRNQQASEHFTVGEDLSPSLNCSAHQDRPGLQSVIARRDPETKEKWSDQEALIACISGHGKQNLGIHRRSYSWPRGW